MEIKNCNIHCRTSQTFILKDFSEDESGDSKITGYASTFENVDSYGDIMKRGAFKASIKATAGKWPVLLSHRDQIGANIVAKETEKGLYVESKIFKNSDIPRAKEAIALIKKSFEYKTPMGLSIGGFVKRIKFINDPEAKDGFKHKAEIYEFQVREHSITPIPANAEALVFDTKSAEFNALKEQCGALEPGILIDFFKKIKDINKRIPLGGTK